MKISILSFCGTAAVCWSKTVSFPPDLYTTSSNKYQESSQMSLLTATRISVFCSSCSKLILSWKWPFGAQSRRALYEQKKIPEENKPSLGSLMFFLGCLKLPVKLNVGGNKNEQQLGIYMFSWKYICHAAIDSPFLSNTKTVCQLVSVMHRN